jgi:hypothetical protein
MLTMGGLDPLIQPRRVRGAKRIHWRGDPRLLDGRVEPGHGEGIKGDCT